MSDQTTWDGSLEEDEETTEPEAVEAVPEEPDEGGTETDESDAEEPAEAPLIFGKYKDMDAAEKGHKELERQFHERQQQPEEEEAEDDDPYGLWGTALGNDEAQQLAQQLIDRPRDAEEIIEYVRENQHLFGPNGADVYQQMYALWNAQNPLAAQQWAVDQRWAEHEARIAEKFAPLQENHEHQMLTIAIHRADQEIPGFRDKWPAMQERLMRPEAQSAIAKDPDYKGNPDKQFNLLLATAQIMAWEEYVQNQQLAAAASGGASTETPATKGKPRTQQRSTAAAPSSDASDDLFEPGLFNGAA